MAEPEQQEMVRTVNTSELVRIQQQWQVEQELHPMAETERTELKTISRASTIRTETMDPLTAVEAAVQEFI